MSSSSPTDAEAVGLGIHGSRSSSGAGPLDNNNLTTSSLEEHEEEHSHDAWTTLWLNVTIVGCLLLAYCVKKFRIYALPESAGALLVGVVVGGIARLTTDQTQLFEFVCTTRVPCTRLSMLRCATIVVSRHLSRKPVPPHLPPLISQSPLCLCSPPKFSFSSCCLPSSSKRGTV